MNGKQWTIAVDSWFDPKKGDNLIVREYSIGDGASGGGTAAPVQAAGLAIGDMPVGLSKMQEAAWKKQNGR